MITKHWSKYRAGNAPQISLHSDGSIRRRCRAVFPSLTGTALNPAAQTHSTVDTHLQACVCLPISLSVCLREVNVFFFFFCVRSKILCVQMFAWNCWRMRQTGHCGRMKMTRLEFILEQERLPLGCWKELKKDWYFGSRGRTVSCSLATPRKTIERFNMLKSCYSEGTHAPTLESLPLMYNHTCACLPLTQAQYICRDKVTAVYDPFCRGRVLLS